MQKGQGLIFVIVGILVLVGVAGGAYFLGKSGKVEPAKVVSQPQISPQTVKSQPIHSVSESTKSAASPAPSDVWETANWINIKSNRCSVSIKVPVGWKNDDRYTQNVQNNSLLKGEYRNPCLYLESPDYREIPHSDGFEGVAFSLDRTSKGSSFKTVVVNNLNDFIKAHEAVFEPPTLKATNVQQKNYGNLSGIFYDFRAMEDTSNFIFEEDNYIYSFSWLKKINSQDIAIIIGTLKF